MNENLPYIVPASGNHAGPRNHDRNGADAIEYMNNGRRILPGFGTHRKNDATESWAA